MSYVLVYSDRRGNEFTDRPCSSITDVNERIRDLHDALDGVVILRIEEQDQDGPRTWQIEYPPAPPAGTRVRTRNGTVVKVGTDGRIASPGGTNFSWIGALSYLGPLTEVVETEVEAAARRLRERGTTEFPYGCPPDLFNDMRTVLAHVLNGGRL